MLSVAKPDYKEHIEKTDALNSDIRHVLQRNFLRNVKEVAPFAKRFKGKTELQTANNIWRYLRKRIHYEKDKPGFQDIRLGRRFFTDKKGDCKSYALNAISLFRAIYPNAPVAYKFTAYKPGKKIPSHVYAVVKDSTGREIIIDGCWNKFNNEKNFTFTLPIQYMTVRTLSENVGERKNFSAFYDALPMEQRARMKEALAAKTKLELIKALHENGKLSKEKAIAGIMEIEDSIVCGIGKLSPEEKKRRRKARNKKALKGLKKFGRGLAFITLAPVRGAFLSLLAMNLNGLASNIKIAHDLKDQSHWEKIMEFWKNVGGIPKIFVKAMQAGTKHKPLWMSKKSKKKYEDRIAQLKKEGKINGLDISNSLDGGIDIDSYLENCMGKGIAIAPAIAAAVIAMGASLLAGIIPLVMKAVKGHPKAEVAAEETGREIIEQTQQGNTYQKAFDNNEGVQPGEAPSPVQLNEDGEPEQSNEEGQSGIGNLDWYKNLIQDDMNGLGAMDAAVQSSLFDSLGKVFAVGTEFVGNVITKKAKKNQNLATALRGGEDYYAQKYSREAQFKPFPRGGGSMFSSIPKPVVYGGLAVVALVAAKKLKLF